MENHKTPNGGKSVARVCLGEDPFIPGRKIIVEASSFCHGERCPICSAVRHAQKGGKPEEYLPPEYSQQTVAKAVWADHLAERRRNPDATLPPPTDVGFALVD
jgi:hypothetical protein